MTTYPEQGVWERREPASVGVDPDILDEAVEFAKDNETDVPNRAFNNYAEHAGEGVYNEIVGPLPRERGGPAGLIVRDGFVIAEWGDPEQTDVTFSVTKSVLSTVAGVAYDQGKIERVGDRVRNSVKDGGFEHEQNRDITWEHLLQQTSEWQGTMFGKPDTVDRKPDVDRRLQSPGEFWEYNDVRVNRLSLSLLRLFQKPVPAVLKEAVMDPIGASDTWKWHGYDHSYVHVDGLTDGQLVKSVSGGGHWGGGLWIDTYDLARFGYLFLRNGRWGSRQVLSREWVDMATTPCSVKPIYGYLWWLNTDQRLWPDAPESSFGAIGFGRNVVWVDPEHDIVVVLRWFDDVRSSDAETDVHPNQNRFYRKVIEAIEN